MYALSSPAVVVLQLTTSNIQQQPVSAAFERIAQAAGLYETWSDTQSHALTDAEQWGQHAVQSVAWEIMGRLDNSTPTDPLFLTRAKGIFS